MRLSGDDLHERVGALKLMEKLIELFKGKLCVYSLSFVFLVQQIHLEVNETLTVALDVRISSCN